MSSDGVREFLALSCRLKSMQPIELLLWVRSRWGSLTHCLEATLRIQKASFFFLRRLHGWFTLTVYLLNRQ